MPNLQYCRKSIQKSEWWLFGNPLSEILYPPLKFLSFFFGMQIVSDEHMDPSALQIEKEQVKTVQFNPDEDVIPYSDHEGSGGTMSGSGGTEEGGPGGSDASEGGGQGEGGGATDSVRSSEEERSGVDGRSLGAEGACGANGSVSAQVGSCKVMEFKYVLLRMGGCAWWW